MNQATGKSSVAHPQFEKEYGHFRSSRSPAFTMKEVKEMFLREGYKDKIIGMAIYKLSKRTRVATLKVSISMQ